MGCHTWFYKRLEVQPTYEEIREKYLEHLSKEIRSREKYLSGKNHELGDILDEIYSQYEKAEIEKEIAILNRIRRRVENRTCKLATIKHACWDNVVDYEYSEHTNAFYIEASYHDIFRIGTYPDNELNSLEETLDFIDFYKTKISLYPDSLEYLHRFWNEHPDGMIRFG